MNYRLELFSSRGITVFMENNDVDPVKDWLNTLNELKFRDRVLEEVFKNMKRSKLIGSYRNIHGRNDKGVDYILIEKAPLGEQVVGVQVKSNSVTRTKGANSAVNIKMECKAAMDHVFKLDKNTYRLDRIEVWNSGKTTQDALDELETLNEPFKIGVKTDAGLVSYIEDFAPKYLKNIPEYSIRKYINNGLGNQMGHFTLLGCKLYPDKHFLEPIFIPEQIAGLGKVELEKKKITKRKGVSLHHILSESQHVVIVGSEMSGKSYTLQHIFSRVGSYADKCIPVFFSGKEVKEITKRNILTKIGKKVCGFKKTQIESFSGEYKFILLLDEIDQLNQTELKNLVELDAEKYRIIATAQRVREHDGYNQYQIAGVRSGSVTKFLKGIDQDILEDGSVADRAHNFIARVTGEAALPQTPFVIAACLQQCANKGNSLNTPTFGHLIGSFVQEQTGIRSRSSIVDFESKRDFLCVLAEVEDDIVKIENYHNLLADFIDESDNPHTIEDFTSDFESSGILRKSRDGGMMQWSNTVYRKYYWVKRSVSLENTNSIEEMLLREKNPTVAAIYASEVGECDVLLGKLMALMSDLDKPSELNSGIAGDLDGLLIDDDEHDEFLRLIENTSEIHDDVAGSEGQKKGEIQEELDFSDEDKQRFLGMAKDLVEDMKENKFFMISNLAAVMLNARRSGKDLKVNSLVEIVHAVMRYGRSASEVMRKHLPNDVMNNFAWLIIFIELQMIDRIVGDAYLKKTFSRYPTENLQVDERLMLAELRLTHGEITDTEFMEEIRSIDLVQVTIAAHLRLAVLYYYRYQKPIEKKRLAKLMKELGRVHKRVSLPKVDTKK